MMEGDNDGNDDFNNSYVRRRFKPRKRTNPNAPDCAPTTSNQIYDNYKTDFSRNSPSIDKVRDRLKNLNNGPKRQKVFQPRVPKIKLRRSIVERQLASRREMVSSTPMHKGSGDEEQQENSLNISSISTGSTNNNTNQQNSPVKLVEPQPVDELEEAELQHHEDPTGDNNLQETLRRWNRLNEAESRLQAVASPKTQDEHICSKTAIEIRQSGFDSKHKRCSIQRSQAHSLSLNDGSAYDSHCNLRRKTMQEKAVRQSVTNVDLLHKNDAGLLPDLADRSLYQILTERIEKLEKQVESQIILNKSLEIKTVEPNPALNVILSPPKEYREIEEDHVENEDNHIMNGCVFKTPARVKYKKNNLVENSLNSIKEPRSTVRKTVVNKKQKNKTYSREGIDLNNDTIQSNEVSLTRMRLRSASKSDKTKPVSCAVESNAHLQTESVAQTDRTPWRYTPQHDNDDSKSDQAEDLIAPPKKYIKVSNSLFTPTKKLNIVQNLTVCKPADEPSKQSDCSSTSSVVSELLADCNLKTKQRSPSKSRKQSPISDDTVGLKNEAVRRSARIGLFSDNAPVKHVEVEPVTVIANSPTSELAIANSPIAERIIINSPISEPANVNSPVADRTIINSPISERANVNSPIANRTIVDSPIVDRTIINSPISERANVNSPIADRTIVNSPIVETTMTNSPIVETTMTNSAIVEMTMTNSPVVKPTILNSPIVVSKKKPGKTPSKKSEEANANSPIVEPTVPNSPVAASKKQSVKKAPKNTNKSEKDRKNTLLVEAVIETDRKSNTDGKRKPESKPINAIKSRAFVQLYDEITVDESQPATRSSTKTKAKMPKVEPVKKTTSKKQAAKRIPNELKNLVWLKSKLDNYVDVEEIIDNVKSYNNDPDESTRGAKTRRGRSIKPVDYSENHAFVYRSPSIEHDDVDEGKSKRKTKKRASQSAVGRSKIDKEKTKKRDKPINNRAARKSTSPQSPFGRSKIVEEETGYQSGAGCDSTSNFNNSHFNAVRDKTLSRLHDLSKSKETISNSSRVVEEEEEDTTSDNSTPTNDFPDYTLNCNCFEKQVAVKKWNRLKEKIFMTYNLDNTIEESSLKYQAGFIKMAPRATKQLEFNTTHTFFAVIKGRAIVRINRLKKVVKESETFCVPKYTAYYITNDSDTDILHLLFNYYING